jgi:2-dehydropantoate 2-reductase
MVNMKIAIIGAGAMGSLFACFLHRAGHEAWLLDKDRERVQGIQEAGITLEDPAGTHRFTISTVTGRAGDIGTADLVIVFVKSYDTAEAVGSAGPIFGDTTLVLTLQNGLNNLETIAAVTGRDRLLGGTTAHGATLLGHGRIRHAGSGDTVIGAFGRAGAGELNMVAGLFNRAGIKTAITGDLITTLWKKLIINAAINPLTALTGLCNGELIEHPGLADVQGRMVMEACTVTEARGISINRGDAVAMVREVCRRTSSNKSSMLQDVLNRRRTEIDSINGAIVAAGEACNVPAPYNTVVTRLVKALELNSRSRDGDERREGTARSRAD